MKKLRCRLTNKGYNWRDCVQLAVSIPTLGRYKNAPNNARDAELHLAAEYLSEFSSPFELLYAL